MEFKRSDTIESLHISNKAINIFKTLDIHYITDLYNYIGYDFSGLPSVGAKTVKDINACMKSIWPVVYDINIWSKIQKYNHVFNCDDGKTYFDKKIKDVIDNDLFIEDLSNLGMCYYSQFSKMSIEEIKTCTNINNLDVLKLLDYQPIQFSKTNCIKHVRELYNLILEDINNIYTLSPNEMFNDIGDKIYTCIDINLVDIEEYLDNNRLKRILCNSNYLKEKSIKYIENICKKTTIGIEFDDILNQMPKMLNDKLYIMDCLEILLSNNDIQLVDGNMYIGNHESFFDADIVFLKDREMDVLTCRFQGKTLEEIGEKHDITRERIRQIESKALKKLNKYNSLFFEDRNKYFYEKYEVTKEEYQFIFGNAQGYYYLKIRYGNTKNEGKSPFEKAIDDSNLPIEVRRMVEKLVFKNYVTIGDERVVCTRDGIALYVLRNYAQKDITYDEFQELYFQIIADIGKEEDDKLNSMYRGYENKLQQASHYALWKTGKKVRYYNMNNRDFSELYEKLDLEQYHDSAYSTRFLYKLHEDLMKQYDIRDEYELHNLLKKTIDMDKYKNIVFGRIPSIDFGNVDKGSQVLNLLIALSPISKADFTEKYCEAYGVNPQTLAANELGDFEEYLENGMYILNLPTLSSELIEIIAVHIDKSFYTINEMNDKLHKLLPNIGKEYYNPSTYKSIGFKTYSSYLISNAYTNAKAYFEYILSSDSIIDLNAISQDIKNIVAFTSVLYDMKSNYDLIEMVPGKCINYNASLQSEIHKSQFFDFINDVKEYVNDSTYFTIHSIKESGFDSELFDYGFENYFYASVLKEAKAEFSSYKLGGTYLFIKGDESLKFESFIENLVYSQESMSIDIYDLCYLLKDKYNINIHYSRITELAKDSSMHYDVISQKIYADYETYFKEI